MAQTEQLVKGGKEGHRCNSQNYRWIDLETLNTVGDYKGVRKYQNERARQERFCRCMRCLKLLFGWVRSHDMLHYCPFVTKIIHWS